MGYGSGAGDVLLDDTKHQNIRKDTKHRNIGRHQHNDTRNQHDTMHQTTPDTKTPIKTNLGSHARPWEGVACQGSLLTRRFEPLQALGCCRESRRLVLKAAPFIGDQRGVLLKALCKPIFVVRSRDKEFEA